MKQGWKIKKLGEVCTIERGGSPRPIQNYITDAEDGINWIKIGDATEGSKYITSTKEKIKPEGMKKSRFVHKGDFILSNSMSFGRPYILAVDGCIHDGWLVIHDNDNHFDKNYLYYYLGSPNIYSEFKRLAVGGVVNNLNSELVRNVKVCVPPIAEQERIVAELDCLSGVIEKKREQLKELDALAESIFYTMFGDPITNEKGWEANTIGNLAEFYNGVAHEGNISENGQYDVVNSKFISTQGGIRKHCDLQMFPLLKNDIVMVMSDVPNGKALAKCYLIEADNKYTLNQRICAFRNYNNFNPIFLYYYLNRHPYYLRFDDGNGQTNLRRNDVLNCPVYIPPTHLQQEFADKIEAIEKQKTLIKQSITQTEELFNAHMDYYFN